MSKFLTLFQSYINAVNHNMELAGDTLEDFYNIISKSDSQLMFIIEGTFIPFQDENKFKYFQGLVKINNQLISSGNGGGNDFKLFFREFLIHYTYTFSKDEKQELINWIKINSIDEKIIPDETPLNSAVKLINGEYESILPPESSLLMPILLIITNNPYIDKAELISASISLFKDINQNERINSFIRLRIIFAIQFLESCNLIKGHRSLELTEMGAILVGINPDYISEIQMMKLLMKYPMEEVFRFYDRID